MSLENDWNEAAEWFKFNNLKNDRKIWYIGQQNKHIDVHLFAINYLVENRNRADLDSVYEEMLEETNNKYEGEKKTLENNRSLVMSKHLGLIKEYKPIEVSKAYEKLISTDNENKQLEILSNQAEKLYFKNGIGSNVNKHAEDNRTAETDFDIYPMFFLYELVEKLKDSGFNSGTISRFEMDYFVIGAQQHDEIETCVNYIINYRMSHTKNYSQGDVRNFFENIWKQESDKYNKPDNRMMRFVDLVKFFHTSSKEIVVLDEHSEEMFERLKKFKILTKNDELIKASSQNNTNYLNLLYSDLDLFEFHKSN